MWGFIKKQPPARIIVFGFFSVILLGSLLLIMPFSLKEGRKISYIDSLYTSTSAVCVTGLIAIDLYDTFSPLGQAIVAILIQIGGLGVTVIGAGVILLLRKKIDLKSRNVIHEAMNLDSGKTTISFIKSVFITTLIIELLGAFFSFFVFVRDYPIKRAIGISLFHSVASFNNSGFDILGDYQNMIPYKDNIMLNIITSLLIILGGIGFLVIKEIMINKIHFKRYSMHAKIVLTVSFILIVVGTLLIKLTEDVTWLMAFFHSVSARTAGFSSCPLGTWTNAGLLVVMGLMFIGASPGSTGGGIKTTSFFVLFMTIKSTATNKNNSAFNYEIPKDAFKKASIITILALFIIIISTYLLLLFDKNITLRAAIFEMTSAFATVGLSTGITPNLSIFSKVVSIIVMFIGRLGPLTIVSLWYFNRNENIKYPEGNMAIG